MELFELTFNAARLVSVVPRVYAGSSSASSLGQALKDRSWFI